MTHRLAINPWTLRLTWVLEAEIVLHSNQLLGGGAAVLETIDKRKANKQTKASKANKSKHQQTEASESKQAKPKQAQANRSKQKKAEAN